MEGVRRATPDDLDRLVELFGAAVEAIRPARGGALFSARELRAVPGDAELAAALADPERVVVAGTFDDVVVGYAIGRDEELRDGTRLGVIDDIYVDAQARGVGVGEAMMAEMLAWFRARGCDAVDGTALPGDRATKNFFESAGFSARLIVMHRRLDR